MPPITQNILHSFLQKRKKEMSKHLPVTPEQCCSVSVLKSIHETRAKGNQGQTG